MSGKYIRLLCATLALSGLFESARAQSDGSSNADIDQAISRFLTAFKNLDWPAFRACFSSSPTVFFPRAEVVRRVEGQEFDKVWQSIFDQNKKRAAEQGRVNPPFLSINPKDVRIDRLDNEVAVVTFHLGAEPRLNRRTLVLQRFPGGWKIVHLHASYLIPE